MAGLLSREETDVIHYDDGILAYKRVYLMATPRIPNELPGPDDNRTEIAWAVDMPAQPIFGIHHPQRGPRTTRGQRTDQLLPADADPSARTAQIPHLAGPVLRSSPPH
ncbi:hypothetical protein ABZ800_22300 [Streptomyces sp. NPDC047813]|uniref:hypothetical protein n=1 Tax=Streptomyces sp. NPDC047813 TaxID=3154608 RepID=UPI0033ED39C3